MEHMSIESKRLKNELRKLESSVIYDQKARGVSEGEGRKGTGILIM